MVLTTIAYETSLQSAMPTDTPDPLLPIPPPSTPGTPLFSADEDDPHKSEALYEPPYILNLRMSHIYRRLRSPAPPPPERELSSDDLLPLPNTTTPWQLTNTLQVLIRARARARQRARTEGDARRERGGEDGDRRTVPGGLDST